MYHELTFDQLPKAVTMLTNEVSELKRLLMEKQAEPSAQSNDKPLSIGEAADFLNLSIPTLYSKVSRGELPVMKRGKRLYFSLAELKEYLNAGRRKSNAEIVAEVDQYLLKSKKG
jgi:excisionase family DNA binding protein